MQLESLLVDLLPPLGPPVLLDKPGFAQAQPTGVDGGQCDAMVQERDVAQDVADFQAHRARERGALLELQPLSQRDVFAPPVFKSS